MVTYTGEISCRFLERAGSYKIPGQLVELARSGNIAYNYDPGTGELSVSVTLDENNPSALLELGIPGEKAVAIIATYTYDTSGPSLKLSLIRGENQVQYYDILAKRTYASIFQPIMVYPEQGYKLRLEFTGDYGDASLTMILALIELGAARELGIGVIRDKLAYRVFSLPEISEPEQYYLRYKLEYKPSEPGSIEALVLGTLSKPYPLTTPREISQVETGLTVDSKSYIYAATGVVMLDITGSITVAGDTLPLGKPEIVLETIDGKPRYPELTGKLELIRGGRVEYVSEDYDRKPYIYNLELTECHRLGENQLLCNYKLVLTLSTVAEKDFKLCCIWGGSKSCVDLSLDDLLSLDVTLPDTIIAGEEATITVSLSPAIILGNITLTLTVLGAKQPYVEQKQLENVSETQVGFTYTPPEPGLYTLTVSESITGKRKTIVFEAD